MNGSYCIQQAFYDNEVSQIVLLCAILYCSLQYCMQPGVPAKKMTLKSFMII